MVGHRNRTKRRRCVHRSVLLFRALTTVLFIAGCADAPSPHPRRGIRPARYTLARGPIEIPGIHNASGLTYRPDTDTLFLVDDLRTVLELRLDGSVKRTIALAGFADTEGIAWLGDGKFAIVEEGRRTICVAEVTPETRQIDYTAAIKWQIDPSTGGNRGLEAVAYEAAARTIFAAKEMSPKRMYRFVLPGTGQEPTVSAPWNAEVRPRACRDISAMCFDPRTGNLLLVSKWSECLIQCATDGKEVARLNLRSYEIPKAEGVAVDRRGTMFICSEPNLLYVFKSKD